MLKWFNAVLLPTPFGQRDNIPLERKDEIGSHAGKMKIEVSHQIEHYGM
jgi:hypothetical protein